jgi:hypothetical protein
MPASMDMKHILEVEQNMALSKFSITIMKSHEKWDNCEHMNHTDNCKHTRHAKGIPFPPVTNTWRFNQSLVNLFKFDHQ